MQVVLCKKQWQGDRNVGLGFVCQILWLGVKKGLGKKIKKVLKKINPDLEEAEEPGAASEWYKYYRNESWAQI